MTDIKGNFFLVICNTFLKLLAGNLSILQIVNHAKMLLEHAINC